MNLLQAKDAAYTAREQMKHDEAAHCYDHAADMCDDPRDAAHCRAMAKSCRKTAQRKREGIIPADWQTG